MSALVTVGEETKEAGEVAGAGAVETPAVTTRHMDGCGWSGTSGETMMLWDHAVSCGSEGGVCGVRGVLSAFPTPRELLGPVPEWDTRCARYSVGAMVEAAYHSEWQQRVLDSWFDYHATRLRAWEWVGALVERVGMQEASPGASEKIARPLRCPLVVMDYGRDAPRTNGGYDGKRGMGWKYDLSPRAQIVADAADGLMPVVILPTRDGRVVRLSLWADPTPVFVAQEVASYATKFAAQHRILSARAERMPGRGREDYLQSLMVDSLLAIETWDPRYTKLSTWLYEKWQHTNTKVLREYRGPDSRKVDEDLVFVVDPWSEADSRLHLASLAKRCKRTYQTKIHDYLSATGGDDTLVYGCGSGVYTLRQIATSDDSGWRGRQIRAGGLNGGKGEPLRSGRRFRNRALGGAGF